MAKCPKCDRKLKLYNISQFCPSCGVNLRFYNFEENFIREAKISELSQAGIKVKLRNLKYSFSGSKLITAKLIVMLLPLLSLLIPSGSIIIDIPFRSSECGFGILGIVSIVTDNLLPYIFSMKDSVYVGAEFSALINALIVYVLVVLFAVFCVLFSLLGFISIKNMHKFTVVFSGCGIIASIVAYVMIFVFNSSAADSLIIQTKNGFGLIVTGLMFAVVFVVNILLWKIGIHPVYDEGMLERVKIYRDVKKGIVSIDSLPQPVVETEATRKIDEAIKAEEKAFAEHMKNMEGGTENEKA